MTRERVGYKRVSSTDQNAARQLDGEVLDEIFVDKVSGKSTDRPELARAIRHCRRGDTFVVHSMDRLARNLIDLRQLVDLLVKGGTLTIDGGEIEHRGGVDVEFLKEKLLFTADTEDPFKKAMLSMLGTFAEFERDLIKQRQAEGIALAKAEGRYRGGQPKLTEVQAAELVGRKNAGESVAALARAFGVSRQTVYRYVNESDS
ncbi:recombinase family protein [Gordonia alkaliphila]|uniref:Recombinase family protein n=1 Tax=Gordonia alkaliphila TaxID=1053547 RepID=A0ABP8Z4I8_9ACTN